MYMGHKNFNAITDHHNGSRNNKESFDDLIAMGRKPISCSKTYRNGN